MAVARAGGQAAFLAPTELLAEQHYYGTRALFEAAGLPSVLLTGSLRAAERRRVEDELELGLASVAFGTHALFSDAVRYRELALAVIDEQHRFGVLQRRRLFEKGGDVHALYMTATPIPRSLALTVYGDLETSVLRELPPGRGELRTRWVQERDRPRMARLLDTRMAAGERVFWVCPRIETSEAGRGAEEAFEVIGEGPLAKHGVELVHGRMPGYERAATLARFRAGETKLLVGTTVLEVGVDVPEATVMVVEGAERFGLAQLHQLRGRVGRGPGDAWCLLLGRPSAEARLRLLERSHDGFELAEEDLRQRGMGDLLGLRQAGPSLEGLAGPAASGAGPDVELLLLARDLVQRDSAVYRAYLREEEPD